MNGRISRFFLCFIRKVLFPTLILLVLSVSAEADIDYIPRYHICIKKLNAEVILDNTFARITGEYSLGYSVRFFQNLPVYNSKFYVPVYVDNKIKIKHVQKKSGLSATVNGRKLDIKLSKTPLNGKLVPCPESMKIVWFTAEISKIKSTLIESLIAELDKTNGNNNKIKKIKEKMESLKLRKKFEVPIKISYIQDYFDLEGEKYFVYLPLLSGFMENKEEGTITLLAQNDIKIKLDSSADSEILNSGQKIKVFPEDFQAVFVKVYN
jgi:hypothetical protein